MRIRVTQRDIDEGVQSNCFHCPVARAVKHVLRASELWVREIIIVRKAHSQWAYVTSEAAVTSLNGSTRRFLSLNPQNPSASLSMNV